MSFGIQVFFNKEWIWLSDPIDATQPEKRIATSFNTEDEAKTAAEYWASKFEKSRVVKLENEI